MCSVFILGPEPLNIYVLLLFAYDYKSINSEGEIVCMWTINRVASREEKRLCMDEHKTHREHLIHTSLFLCVECCQQKPKKNQFRIDNNSQPNNFLYVAKHLNGQEKVRFETKQCEFVSCLRCDWMWSAIGITCMDNKQKKKTGTRKWMWMWKFSGSENMKWHFPHSSFRIVHFKYLCLIPAIPLNLFHQFRFYGQSVRYTHFSLTI